jgi:hypothetical protein
VTRYTSSDWFRSGLSRFWASMDTERTKDSQTLNRTSITSPSCIT